MSYANRRRFVPSNRKTSTIRAVAVQQPRDLADAISYPESQLAEVQQKYGGTWIAYTNLWTKERQVYKPATAGTFVYAFRSGENGQYDEVDGAQRCIQLGYGSVSSPQWSFTALVADFALLLAQYPILDGRLSLYRVPCVFSSRDGWVEVPYAIFGRYMGRCSRDG
jgi:hypothetical protein